MFRIQASQENMAREAKLSNIFNKRQILIACQNSKEYSELENLLNENNFKVQYTRQTKQIADVLANEKIDFLIFEAVKTFREELQEVQIIRSIYPDLEIIILAEKNDLRNMLPFIENGVYHLLKTPFDVSLLYAAIIKATERQRLIFEIKDYQKKLELKVLERSEELRVVQEQLLRNEKLAALGQSLAGIVHEINNPLSVIYGRSQLLLMKKTLSENAMRDVKIIEDQVHKTKNITSRILKFSKPTKPLFNRENLFDIVNEVIVLLEYEFATQHIKINKKFRGQTIFVSCDADQIQELVINLMTNAKHAMKEGGEISISLSQVKNLAEIRIKDTGTGIPPDNMVKLFDPFFTTKATGTGLGLSICYSIIREHGGDIKVYSEVDKGAEFVITLPVI